MCVVNCYNKCVCCFVVSQYVIFGCVYIVEPPSKGHFGTNINSGHLSFIEGLSLFGGIFGGTIHYASHKKLSD